MDVKKDFYSRLPSDKIKINWNKNPVKMDEFLSFLTVPVIRSRNHLGSVNGWTLLENKDLSLYIKGGIIGGVEYLDSLQFGSKLSNPYNNYVNPFYLWDILTPKGRSFFLNYYADDIEKIIKDTASVIDHTKRKLETLKHTRKEILAEIDTLKKESSL